MIAVSLNVGQKVLVTQLGPADMSSEFADWLNNLRRQVTDAGSVVVEQLEIEHLICKCNMFKYNIFKCKVYSSVTYLSVRCI